MTTQAAERAVGSAPSTPGRAGAHLAPEVRDVLDLPKADRIAFAQSGSWIDHTAVVRARAALEDLLVRPRVERMPCLLVAAASGNGKSSLLRTFAAAHAPHLGADDRAVMPVVLMEMPEKPTDGLFWSDLLDALNVAHRPTAPVAANRDQALRVLEVIRCRMLVIDEVHNILQVGPAQQRQMLALIKTLSNRLMVPVVTAGTQDAIRTMQTDKQLEDRFSVLGLPRWRLNEDYRRLLMSMEARLPLRHPSGLDGRELATAIFDRSNRTIGSISRIAAAAAVAAIRDGTERITPRTLDGLDAVPLKGFDANSI